MSEVLSRLFKQRFGEEPTEIVPVGAHASQRRIVRLRGTARSVVGVFHNIREENRAFIEFTRHFRSFGLPVPEILAEDRDGLAYLQEDLGEVTLYDRYRELTKSHGLGGEFPVALEKLFSEAVTVLPRFQIEAGRTLDFSLCYPSRAYDRNAMLWDMHYFRDSFLIRTKVPFEGTQLENDFQRFAEYLCSVESSYFVYRDFQSRNIMVHNDKLYFIDYQSGKKGALHYDIATILYQSKAPLPSALRQKLLSQYIEQASKLVKIDCSEFERQFRYFVLIQLMHRFGTYGRQGLEYGKRYFIESIPLAVDNLKEFLGSFESVLKLPAIRRVLEEIVARRDALVVGRIPPSGDAIPLTINITSFSYKKGVPQDTSVHGGGFIFDCRCVLNPGREQEYKEKSGLDPEVAQFIDKLDGGARFRKASFALVDQAIESYMARGFSNLMVAFGCTGGQHRSVYFSETLARYLRERGDVQVTVIHRDLGKK